MDSRNIENKFISVHCISAHNPWLQLGASLVGRALGLGPSQANIMPKVLERS